jgi:hypothetical protein
MRRIFERKFENSVCKFKRRLSSFSYAKYIRRCEVGILLYGLDAMVAFSGE